MKAYAVVETGGKQYRVHASDTLRVERLPAAVGEKITLQPVLAVSNGETLTVGRPYVEKAEVMATVVEHVRADKVVAYRKKRRKGYSRKQGHRQEQTVLKIESV
ncbi:MAG: 50S ribosomal protein L21 [Kiritimatiellia bacterium]|jgi:large subunit ribosomal protein L21